MKKIQLYICPNPECEKAFENLILINNKSEEIPEKFYGCPFCFLKLDPTILKSLKKIEKVIEEPENILPLEKEMPKCPHHFGYLSEHFHNSIITSQCLACKKMDDCMKYQKEVNI